MKLLSYTFLCTIFFLSIITTAQACDDEEIDVNSLYDAYEFEAEDD